LSADNIGTSALTHWATMSTDELSQITTDNVGTCVVDFRSNVTQYLQQTFGMTRTLTFYITLHYLVALVGSEADSLWTDSLSSADDTSRPAP